MIASHLKTTETEEFYPGSPRRQIADKLAELDREIEWNIRRLGNLVLSDEDREQTEDLVHELRTERKWLLRHPWLAEISNAG